MRVESGVLHILPIDYTKCDKPKLIKLLTQADVMAGQYQEDVNELMNENIELKRHKQILLIKASTMSNAIDDLDDDEFSNKIQAEIHAKLDEAGITFGGDAE